MPSGNMPEAENSEVCLDYGIIPPSPTPSTFLPNAPSLLLPINTNELPYAALCVHCTGYRHYDALQAIFRSLMLDPIQILGSEERGQTLDVVVGFELSKRINEQGPMLSFRPRSATRDSLMRMTILIPQEVTQGTRSDQVNPSTEHHRHPRPFETFCWSALYFRAGRYTFAALPASPHSFISFLYP
jgi:hypothetical protein